MNETAEINSMKTENPAYEVPRCVLCKSHHTFVKRNIDIASLVTGWRERYGIDIVGELDRPDREFIKLIRCDVCKLGFFDPILAGSASLYEHLQKFSWYYTTDRWEHRVALADIPTGSRVLEVGCGEGDFLDKAVSTRGCTAEGIELNAKAVEVAVAKGRQVEDRYVESLASERPGCYDAVCSFQVLEHVSDPIGFLQACIDLLKPGGILIACVPNNDGFIRLEKSHLLNMPPHHITHWNQRVFEYLPKLFPVEVNTIRFDPLYDEYVEWYISAHFSHSRGSFGTVHGLALRYGAPLIRKLKLNKLLRGERVYASFRKTSGKGN